jgi:ribonuclease P protein component
VGAFAGSDFVVSDTPKGIFPKSAHLLKHVDFRHVYENGKRHFSGNLTVFYLHRAPLEPENINTAAAELPAAEVLGARIGFTVSRALGDAVERNRIRRRMREAVRQHYSRLAGELVDVVINPRKTVLRVDFTALSQEVARAFTIIGQSARPGRTRPGVGSRKREKPRLAQERNL